MKSFLKIKKVFLCFLFLNSVLYAQSGNPRFRAQKESLDDEKYSRLKTLLNGYLENDLQLQKYTLTAQNKALSLDSTKISNGIDVELSSGNISVTTDTSQKTKITMNPSVSVSIPQANEGSLSVNIPVTIEDGEKSVSNGVASAGVAIISGSAKKRNVTILEAERAYVEAQRNVRNRTIEAEKEFFEELKKLYGYAIKIHSHKSDLYDDTVNLKVLETQGYSKTSAKYRQAFLKVKSDLREVQEQQRIFERETAIFAMKCGKEFVRSTEAHDSKKEKGIKDEGYDPVKAGETAYEESILFLPDSIPAVKTERIFDYSQELYSKSEKARWEKQLGQLKRDADYDFSLKVSADYKFNSSQSGYDDAGGKLTMGWKGLSLGAGAYVPTGNNLFPEEQKSSSSKNDSPYFQFSVALSPNEWRLSKISGQQDKIDAQLEEIAVKDAADDYNTDVLSKVSTFHDIKWSENSYAEEYDMYTKLEADMAQWLQQGIVTENDYLDARNNKEKARLNIMINALELLIYNDEVKLLFVE